MLVLAGASGGIGRAIVDELAHDDGVIAIYRSRIPMPEHPRVRWCRVDLTSTTDIEHFADAVDREATQLTLVNLAAVAVDRLAIRMHPDEWDAVLRVNLTGAFLLSRALLRPMMRERWGRIINVSSTVTHAAPPGTAAYAASKGGMDALTRALAREYARFNITVNALALGWFDAGLSDTLPPERKARLLRRIPCHRFGQPAEVVDAIRYLRQSGYTNGATLVLDGGVG